jgi:predicted nucleic acid-binding protein
MVAVDTNIIVRLLTRDDESQYQKSVEIFQGYNVFIPDTVILEVEWVLRFSYKFKPIEICEALRNLFGLPNVSVKNPNLLIQVLKWHEFGLDFADALHLGTSKNYDEFYTFDDKLIKKAKGLTSCQVKQP